MMRQLSPESTLSISLSSSEALWEWNIPLDTLYLTEGSCRDLGFLGLTQPTTMTTFLAHIPAPCLPTLHEVREGVLNGTQGAFLESVYPFDHLFVRERMLVLARDAEGRAVRAIGQFTVSTKQPSYFPPWAMGTDALVEMRPGYWTCSFEDRKIYTDSRFAALLGYAEPRPLELDLDEWKARMHPDERQNVGCRHQLILEQPVMGDILEDLVQIRLEKGEYARRIIRGAVLSRNAEGRALMAAGSLQIADASRVEDPVMENGRLLFAINATGDGLWDWDAQTDLVYYSPRYLSMLGYTAEQFAGTLEVWKKKIHPDDHDKIVYPQQKIVESPIYGDTFECTYRLLCADGTWAWILGRGYVTHRDSMGKATRLVGMHTNITNPQNERAELEMQVKNDPLTGLRSRTYCDMELQRIEKNHIRPLSVISCDINGLKMVNDYMGHHVGDELLRKVALMLREHLRATDCVARMGGDEFVILLPACTAEKARSILEQTEQHFAAHNVQTESMPIFVSFGLASSQDPHFSASRLLIEADRSMLVFKEQSRRPSHRRIRDWIEKSTSVSVPQEDSRYEC